MGWRGIADAVRAETWGVEGSRRVKRLAIGGGLSLTRRLAAVDGTDATVGGGRWHRHVGWRRGGTGATVGGGFGAGRAMIFEAEAHFE